MAFKSFEELKCWKAGVELRKFISGIIRKLPKDEFELKDNVKRIKISH